MTVDSVVSIKSYIDISNELKQKTIKNQLMLLFTLHKKKKFSLSQGTYLLNLFYFLSPHDNGKQGLFHDDQIVWNQKCAISFLLE